MDDIWRAPDQTPAILNGLERRAVACTIPAMNTHGPLNIDVLVEPMFQENCLLLWTDDGPAAWIIDPGLPPQHEQVAAALKERGLTAEAILITHVHTDHIGGVEPLCEQLPDVKLMAPRGEESMLSNPVTNLSRQIGLEVVTPPASRLLEHGDELTLGTLPWKVLDVAGHSPGGLAFYCQEAGVVIVGDALFAGSIGRTDFPGSSGPLLLENIRRHLLTLPDDTVVYSGHGPTSTIAIERASNPFLQDGFAL